MEKEKKVATKTTKKANAKPNKIMESKAPLKSKKVEEVKPVEVKTEPVVAENVKPVKTEKKPITLNQDLNILLGLFSFLTIITFCLAFQGGDAEVLGWELFLKAKNYSTVFQGLMIVYVASIVIDCILAIRVESENEVLNIIEKVLYMFTLVINVIVAAVLISVISKVGIGLIIFLILSVVSVIVKLVRVYAQNK